MYRCRSRRSRIIRLGAFQCAYKRDHVCLCSHGPLRTPPTARAARRATHNTEFRSSCRSTSTFSGRCTTFPARPRHRASGVFDGNVERWAASSACAGTSETTPCNGSRGKVAPLPSHHCRSLLSAQRHLPDKRASCTEKDTRDDLGKPDHGGVSRRGERAYTRHTQRTFVDGSGTVPRRFSRKHAR